MSTPRTDDNVVMRVVGVSKRFSCSPEKARRPGTREVLRAMFGRAASTASTKLRTDEFWAIRDVNFTLNRGEALGIVGLNGAGKSTLLKMILGRLRPDDGSIEVFGKAGGLIELGAGFHPELSGRRNIYLNASLLGIPEVQVDKQVGAIIDFADIGRFIDSPVKTYSSGMRVRLGFAVTVHFVPDLVVCDEVLAVGDFEFRQKCLHKIKEIRRTRSVILVSHSTADIALFCDRAMLLHHGECILVDSPKRVLQAFSVCTSHISANEVRRRTEKVLAADRGSQPAVAMAATARVNDAVPALVAAEAPRKSRPVPKASDDSMEFAPLEGTAATLTDKKRQPLGLSSDETADTELFGPAYWNKNAIKDVTLDWSFEENEKGYFVLSGEPLHLRLSFTLQVPVERFRIGFPIFTDSGIMLLGPDSRHSLEIRAISGPGKYCIAMCLDPLPLNSGRFRAVLSICDDPAQLFRRHLPFFQVFNPTHEFGVAKSFSVWTTSITTDQPLTPVLGP